MHSSLTRKQRNSDPHPYMEVEGGFVHVHRSKFQHGRIAVNPILVEARKDYELRFIKEFQGTHEWALEQLAALSDSKILTHTRQGRRVIHARRVFTLLAALSKDES